MLMSFPSASRPTSLANSVPAEPERYRLAIDTVPIVRRFAIAEHLVHGRTLLQHQGQPRDLRVSACCVTFPAVQSLLPDTFVGPSSPRPRTPVEVRRPGGWLGLRSRRAAGWRHPR